MNEAKEEGALKKSKLRVSSLDEREAHRGCPRGVGPWWNNISNDWHPEMPRGSGG